MIEVKTTKEILNEYTKTYLPTSKAKDIMETDKRWVSESDFLDLKKRLGELAESINFPCKICGSSPCCHTGSRLMIVKRELLELSKT